MGSSLIEWLVITCCLSILRLQSSLILASGSLFKLFVHPFHMALAHFMTLWYNEVLQATLLFFWLRPGNLPFVWWDLVPFNREMVFRKQGLGRSHAPCDCNARDLSRISGWRSHIIASNSNPTTKCSFQLFLLLCPFLPSWTVRNLTGLLFNSSDGPHCLLEWLKKKGGRH